MEILLGLVHKNMLVFIKFLLFPFSVLFFTITEIKNWLYDTGILNTYSPNIPTIIIGNLSTGGTGKTPHTEYLIKTLKADYNLATLSRGYGRNTSGFLIANSRSDAKSIGDEPYQMYKKYNHPTAVCENRVIGIKTLQHILPKINLILLDDAFQHRRLNALVNILLTPYHDLFIHDYLLPVGSLREHKRHAKRAHIIIVTKCPMKMNKRQSQVLKKKLQKYTQHIFFSTITYQNIQFLTHPILLDNNTQFILFTGIKNSSSLNQLLKKQHTVSKHFEFSDHHTFTSKNIDNICVHYNLISSKNKAIITTEKDFSRLCKKHKEQLSQYTFAVIPIKISIQENDKFMRLVNSMISTQLQ